jgi:hypothetical protein
VIIRGSASLYSCDCVSEEDRCESFGSARSGVCRRPRTEVGGPNVKVFPGDRSDWSCSMVGEGHGHIDIDGDGQEDIKKEPKVSRGQDGGTSAISGGTRRDTVFRGLTSQYSLFLRQ